MFSKKSRRYLLLFILLLTSLFFVHIIVENELKGRSIQKGIAEDIIRFHVIANSNNLNDQMIKYKVKDALVKELSPWLENAQSKDEVQRILEDKLKNIEEVAMDVLRQNDCKDVISVSLSNSYFPMKAYGAYTFPPGHYDSLRVEIGSAKGENWWCVLFPPLCFIDETYSIVDKETDEQLQFLLTEEEYCEIANGEISIVYKSKLWEMLKSWLSS